MKLLFVLTLCLIVFLGCNKKDKLSKTISPVAGNWGYAGSDGLFLKLSSNGKAEKWTWDTIHYIQYNHYEIVNDSTIRFFLKIIGPPVIAKYTLSNNNRILHLSGACIYDCEETFGRILSTDYP